MATGENKRITGSLILEDRYQTTIYDDILAITNATVSLLDPAGEIFTDKGNDTVTVTNSTISDNSATGADLMFSMGSGDDILNISETTLDVNTFMGSGDDEVFIQNNSYNSINKKLSLGTGNDTLTLAGDLSGSGDIDFGDGIDTLVFNNGTLTTTGKLSGLENLTVASGSNLLRRDLELSGTASLITLNASFHTLFGNQPQRITINAEETTLITGNNIKTDIGFVLNKTKFSHSAGGSLEFDGVLGNDNIVAAAFLADASQVTLHDIVVSGNLKGYAFKGSNTTWVIANSNIANSQYGIFENGGSVDLTDVGISQTNLGAAVDLSNADLTGAAVSFSNNRRAIYADQSDIEIENGIFNNNYVYLTFANGTATAYGGAIAQSGGDMTLTEVAFSGNYATGYNTGYACGGAIAQTGGDMVLAKAVFSGNYASAFKQFNATAYGGAIAQSDGDMTLTEAVFSGNYASAYATDCAIAYGGAIAKSGGSITLKEVTFSGNHAAASATAYHYYTPQGAAFATAYGGAIAATDSILNITDAVFTDNSACATCSANYSHPSAYGGAIAVKNSTVNYLVSQNKTITNTDNRALTGGFIYLDGVSTAVFNVQGTLTVGDNNGNDSIAGTASSTIVKQGSGVWSIKSDISSYYGKWNVAEGVLKLERIVRNITLDNWTIGSSAELHLSALNDTISMGMDKKIGIIDLGGGSDIINTGGYQLSGGLLRISKLTLTGGGRVSSEITNRTAGAGFDLTLNNVTLDSIITGGNAADKITITQSSTIGGALNLGNGANSIIASSATETIFSKAVTLGTGNDTLKFCDVDFKDSLTLGNGDNSLTATGTASFSGTVNMGSGNDILTFASATFKKDVALGDGNNKLTANTAIFNGALTAGSGNDTINLKENSEINGNIALGGGRNYIYVTQTLTINDGFTLDANGETHLLVYNKASLSSNTLNVYSPDNKNMATASYDWSDVEGLDKVRILVSSDATFETFEFTVELYNQSKEFTLNVSDNYFVQFQAQDEDGWTHRILADDEAPDQVSGFAMDGTTAVWDATHDNWGGNGVKKYNIQVASDANFKSLIGTYTSSENTYSFDSYADGNYFIRIQAEDHTGNKGAWSNIESFLIDNSAPTKPESVYGTASSDSISAVWHEATDSGSGVKEYKIEFSTTSTFSNIAHSATVAGTAYTAANLTDGTYYFRVAAIDNVNNMGEWSSAASAVVDTIGPDSVSGISVSQNAGVITLSWNTASDSGVGVKEYNIQYSTDMNFTSAAGSLSSGSTSCNISDLADGDYYFRIQAVDKNGNVGHWSNAATATVDGTAPSAPAGLLVVPGAYSATLSWNAASDALSGVKEYEYLISSDSNFSSIEFSGTTSALSQAISNIGYGSYYFKVRAVDNYGNVGSWSTAETFSIADATKPELTISGNPVNWTNQPVIISANASDSESGIKTLEYSTDNRTWKNGSAVSVNANGNLYFRATDNDGNVTVKSVSVTMIDTAAPDLSISGNTDTVTNQNVLLSADCNDSESGIKFIQYSFDNRTWFTGSAVSVDENKTIYFKVTDNADNVTEKSFAVSNIDKTAPLKPTASANITTVTNQNVTVSAAFSNDSVIREYSFDCNTWLTYTTGIVMENNGSVYFRGQDAAGNWSDVTTYQVSNIDRSGPDAPVLYASTSKLTNKNVTIWADYSLDCTLLYSYNQQTWYEYDDSGLTVSRNGNIYFKAADAIGNFSEVVCFQVSNIDKIAPLTPEGFSDRISGSTVLLDWDDSSDNGVAGIKGYKIRYGTSSDLSGEGVFTAASEFDLTDLSCGTYYYQVKTEDNAGNSSEWSEVQSFEITSPLVQNLKGDRNGLSWDILPGAAGYVVEYSANDFKTVIAIETASNAVDAFALPQGAFKWRVRALESTGWAYGTGITGTGSSKAEVLASDTDGDMDLFFGSADGIWEAQYAAQHLGNDTWQGTGEQVLLAGKNKIADIFKGSDDANILVLTDDTNGDALFVDDIYTALGAQARFSQIDEIRAGAGDDIIDMTSKRYTYEGGSIKICGGAGNDTIWANAGNNTLFGDAGNDRIVGSSENDVIVGGSGNDSMHGGGGNDIFTFGADWGNDTVKQLASGSVTLWFESGSESNWNAQTLTYSNGVNSVTVTGTTDITLKFGSTESAVDGAFLDAASEKVFEDKNKGFIA